MQKGMDETYSMLEGREGTRAASVKVRRRGEDVNVEVS